MRKRYQMTRRRKAISRCGSLAVCLVVGIATVLIGDPWGVFTTSAQADNLKANVADVSGTVFAPLGSDGRTVERVEPVRYLGKWYEVATIPIVFQLLCTGSTAEYSYVDPVTIGVENQCALGTLKGPKYDVNGFARILDSESNARLSVSFGKKPTNFGAPYWVIELDGSEKNGPYEKYEWAVVGGPTSKSLWILSRTPQMDAQRLQLILDRLSERGYDLSKLKFTKQHVK